MAKWLRPSDKDFDARFNALVADSLENDPEVNRVVTEIIEQVKTRGDGALLEYTNRFDRVALSDAKALKIAPDAIHGAYASTEKPLQDALNLAASRIRAYHEKQMPSALAYEDALSVKLGFRWTAVESAGLYVPGGTASYPSSVLMNGIPAKVAGVDRLTMVVPAPGGTLNPLVLAAAHVAGVDEIYTVGGAQAVAALAYGTQTIKRVNIIVGPGNAYVAAAKKHLYGVVGIDMIAGPSEILVVADNRNNPAWIAADLLSQAEHDTAARAILITDDEAFAKHVEAAVEATLSTLSREAIARSSWEQHGAIICVKQLEDAIPYIDRIAPEHLELCIEQPEAYAAKLRNAGAIFLGRYTPEAIGDYMAGPSHVLPTAATAAFSSGLSVFDFLKRSSMIGCSENALKALAEPTALLADAEGLGAHALSVRVRIH
jgi:histidinol dehydrogenase